MRLVAGLLALTLFAPFASADDAKASSEPARAPAEASRGNKIPLRVVRVMPESRQALLFDRSRSTHVLAEVGGKVDGYLVEEIDDDQVTLRFEGTQIVLAAPMYSGARRRDREPAGQAGRVRSASAAQPAQPADTASDGPSPADPYGEPEVRVVSAPGAAQGASGGATARPADAASAPAATTRPADAAPSAPAAGATARPRTIEPGDGGVRVAVAPSTAGGPSAARPIEPGADGVRVVAAPRGGPADGPVASGDSQPPTAGSAVAGSAASARGAASPASNLAGPAPGADGVRVVAAPRGGPVAEPGSAGRGSAPESERGVVDDPVAGPAPTAVSAPATALSPTAAAPASPAANLAGPAPGGDGVRVVVAPRDASGDAPATGASPAPAGASTPAAARVAPPQPVRAPAPVAPAPRSAADKQADDARALADVFATEAPRSARRSPSSAVRSARAPAAPASEIRTAVAAPAGATAASGGTVLSRAEVDTALADFARLTAAMRGSFTASGVAVESVGDGTIFARAGLRAGDLITAVDGTRLRSLDDAANLYARASSAKAVTAQIVRNGAPVTLRVAIQ